MKIEKIKELVSNLEITTPSAMGQELRKSDVACRKEMEEWFGVAIEKQVLLVKDERIAEDLDCMVASGLLTNITKYRYDHNTYRKAAISELEENYVKFMVGKRPFYVKKECE